VELRLDNVDPCSLLTDAQRSQLGVAQGTSNGPVYSGPLQGPICVWPNLALSPDNGWTGGVVLNHGADYALGREPLRSVDGFAATTTGSTGTDPAFYCLILVDVAPGQALSAAYGNNAHDVPDMNHQLACANAQKLATAMLTTLRTQLHK
jgi:hypothetical protein